jgi:hypothetical protein
MEGDQHSVFRVLAFGGRGIVVSHYDGKDYHYVTGQNNDRRDIEGNKAPDAIIQIHSRKAYDDQK